MYKYFKNGAGRPAVALAALLIAAMLGTMLQGCIGKRPGDTTSTAAPGSPHDPATSGKPGTSGTPSGTTDGTSDRTGTDTEPQRQIEIPANAIDAAQAIIYDTTARRTLFSHNGVIDGKVYPASTTKLFTAWVALQYLAPDDIITAGDELSLVAKDASIAYIKHGHKLKAAMLVEAMLLPSGGDGIRDRGGGGKENTRERGYFGNRGDIGICGRNEQPPCGAGT